MNNEQPEPRHLRATGNVWRLNSQAHQLRYEALHSDLRTDLILYGTLSQDQFQSIRQFLIFETKGTVEQVRNFFEPCIRLGKKAKRLSGSPKSLEETQEPNTLEAFL